MEWNSNSCCSFSLECMCQNEPSHSSSAAEPIGQVQGFARAALLGHLDQDHQIKPLCGLSHKSTCSPFSHQQEGWWWQRGYSSSNGRGSGKPLCCSASLTRQDKTYFRTIVFGAGTSCGYILETLMFSCLEQSKKALKCKHTPSPLFSFHSRVIVC